MFSNSNPLRANWWTTTIDTGMSKSGIAGMAGIFGISGIFGSQAIDFFRSASGTLIVIGWPSRLMPRLTTRPGGVSLIMRRSCAALSTAVPFTLTMTSCSCTPAFPAARPRQPS